MSKIFSKCLITLGLSSLFLMAGCGNEEVSNQNQPQQIESNTETVVKKKSAKSDTVYKGDIVDINTANKEELVEALKGTGVGEEKVKAIIAYREEHGGFKTIEELNDVKGIGNKTLEKMRPRISVSAVAKAKKTESKPVKVKKAASE